MSGYIVGATIGLTYGGVAGIIKYRILWGGKNSSSGSDFTAGMMYLKMSLSFILNVIILLVPFLTRNLYGFNFMTTILATAVGLSLTGKLSPLGKKLWRVREDR